MHIVSQEGLPYFKNFVPWAKTSAPSITGLREQVVHSLHQLDKIMTSRRLEEGIVSKYIAGGDDLSIADLQLYTTMEFMSNPKVNAGKLTEKFDPKSTVLNETESLQEWFTHMKEMLADHGK